MRYLHLILLWLLGLAAFAVSLGMLMTGSGVFASAPEVSPLAQLGQVTASPSASPHLRASNSVLLHLSFNGRPPQPDPLQSLPVQLEMTSDGGQSFVASTQTDSSGNLALDLQPGTYSFWVKSSKFLASDGYVEIGTGGTYELGTVQPGDIDGDNHVSASDFSAMVSSWGLTVGDLGYDDRADLNGDHVVNALDFNLLRRRFGQAGPAEPNPWEVLPTPPFNSIQQTYMTIAAINYDNFVLGGQVLYGDYTYGYYRAHYQSSAWTNEAPWYYTLPAWIPAMAVDPSNQLWVATVNTQCIHPECVTRCTSTRIDPSNGGWGCNQYTSSEVSSLHILNSNDVWAGGKFYGRVASHWNGQTWTDVGPSSPWGNPRSIRAVSDTNVWVTDPNGIFHFDGSSWTLVPPPNGHNPSNLTSTDYTDNTLWAVASDSSGNYAMANRAGVWSVYPLPSPPGWVNVSAQLIDATPYGTVRVYGVRWGGSGGGMVIWEYSGDQGGTWTYEYGGDVLSRVLVLHAVTHVNRATLISVGMQNAGHPVIRRH